MRAFRLPGSGFAELPETTRLVVVGAAGLAGLAGTAGAFFTGAVAGLAAAAEDEVVVAGLAAEIGVPGFAAEVAAEDVRAVRAVPVVVLIAGLRAAAPAAAVEVEAPPIVEARLSATLTLPVAEAAGFAAPLDAIVDVLRPAADVDVLDALFAAELEEDRGGLLGPVEVAEPEVVFAAAEEAEAVFVVGVEVDVVGFALVADEASAAGRLGAVADFCHMNQHLAPSPSSTPDS